jgi:hypothetical protein
MALDTVLFLNSMNQKQSLFIRNYLTDISIKIPMDGTVIIHGIADVGQIRIQFKIVSSTK